MHPGGVTNPILTGLVIAGAWFAVATLFGLFLGRFMRAGRG